MPGADRIGRFWLRYWLTFFVLLPMMLGRQALVVAHQLLATVWTYNRSFRLLNGNLEVMFVSRLRCLAISAIFGERFGVARFGGVIVDPGPPFAASTIVDRLGSADADVRAILLTHAHEEHSGSAAMVARRLRVPVYGSAASLRSVRGPARLSFVRRMMIGQPSPATLDRRGTLTALESATGARPIASHGHCDGHVSYFVPREKILFVGDSFMAETFTSPNGEVDAFRWRDTLRNYAALDIKTMIGTHGNIVTGDARIPTKWGVVERGNPNEMIARKLAFLDWATAVVRAGEDRGLPYSVIEASLFPWSRTWSWRNFFGDELARLLSGGEFSRTHFVRSVSRYPERVPPRFGSTARLRARWAKSKQPRAARGAVSGTVGTAS